MTCPSRVRAKNNMTVSEEQENVCHLLDESENVDFQNFISCGVSVQDAEEKKY